MGGWEAPREDFPATTFKLVSAVHLVMAASLMALGIGDVAHTFQTYGDTTNANCTGYYPRSMTLGPDWKTPCDNDVLKYAYASCPIWTGALVALVSLVGSMIDIKANRYTADEWRRRFMYISLLAGVIFLPVTLGVAIAEFVEGRNVFYAIGQNTSIEDGMLDEIKYVIPLVVIMVAVVAWLTALFSAYLAHSTSLNNTDQYYDDDKSEADYNPMYGNAMTMPPMMVSPYATSPMMMAPSGGVNGATYATYGGRPATFATRPATFATNGGLAPTMSVLPRRY